MPLGTHTTDRIGEPLMKRRSWIVLWVFDLVLLFLQPAMPSTQIPSFNVEAIRGPGGVELARPIEGEPANALFFRVIGVDYSIGTEAPTEIYERDAGQEASTRVALHQAVITREGGHVRIAPWWTLVVFPVTVLIFLASLGVLGLICYAQKDLHIRRLRIRGWQWIGGMLLIFPLTVNLTESTTLIVDNAADSPVVVTLNSYSMQVPATTRMTATVAAFANYRITTRKADGDVLDDATVQFERNWTNVLNVGRANSYELKSTSYRK